MSDANFPHVAEVLLSTSVDYENFSTGPLEVGIILPVSENDTAGLKLSHMHLSHIAIWQKRVAEESTPDQTVTKIVRECLEQ